jgi:hypothetical protein
VRFPFDAAPRQAFLAGAAVEIAVEHANYRASTVLSAAVQQSLAEDLAE